MYLVLLYQLALHRQLAHSQRNEVIMAKRHIFKKVKPGEPIPVTARQLDSFMLEHKGKFGSLITIYLSAWKLTEPPICDATHELRLVSSHSGRNQKILCITATILTKHSTDPSIDSHRLFASGF